MWTLIVLSSLAAPDPALYATTLRTALLAPRAPAVAKAPTATLGTAAPMRATLLELAIASDGAVRTETLLVSSGGADVDDFARSLVLASEPFVAPEAELASAKKLATCLARISVALGKPKAKVDAQVACFAPDSVVPKTAGVDATLGAATDAGAELLLGYEREGAGDFAAARSFYEKAATLAPGCDLAARAVGLALLRAKRGAAAIPFLRAYVMARAPAPDAIVYGREIERFEKEQAARAAEFSRVRPRLAKEELALGVRKGYALLEPCLAKARQKQLLALGADTLLVSFRINKDGSVEAPQLNGPEKLLMTDAAECLEGALAAWRFPPYSEGSTISAQRLPIKVRGSSPPSAVASVSAGGGAAASGERAAPPEDELTFSQCERGAEEVSSYVAEHQAKVAACLATERQREPKASWPEAITLSFVIDAAGPVRGVSIDHRFFRSGPLATCVAGALAGSLPASAGADCPAELPIDLRRFVEH